jgi:hypothetical protein
MMHYLAGVTPMPRRSNSMALTATIFLLTLCVMTPVLVSAGQALA